MKRLALLLVLILSLALVACDTMGPKPQQLMPTEAYPADVAGDETVPAAPSDAPETPIDAPADADLFGVTWEWSILVDSMGQTAIADPTRYTAVFNPDGTMNIKADCNTATSQFVTNGPNIQIIPGVMTLAACGPDSQGQLFLNSLNAAESYSVEAGELTIQLTAGSGTMMFRTGATGDTVEAPESGGATALTASTWEWVSIATGEETADVVDPSRYQITFNEDGSASIKADCNTVIAGYAAGEDGSMRITLGPSTLAACPEDSQADLLMVALPNVALYSFIDGDLVLDLPFSSGSIRLRAVDGATTTAPDTGLTGVTWQWASTVTPMEEITVADPSRYTIVFFDDGTAGIKADCNVGNAEYTAGEDKTISIVLGVTTLAFCEESQDQIFRTGLEAAAVYFFDENGDLMLDMMASSGTMRFVAAADAPVEGDEPAPPAGGQEALPSPIVKGDVLTGTTWQLTLVATAGGNLTINDPSRYTIAFNVDGTANIQADCNSVIAAYVLGEGNTMTITPGPSTMAYCGAGSLDQIYLGGLTNAMGYRLEDGNLLIDMLYASGTLVFAPAP